MPVCLIFSPVPLSRTVVYSELYFLRTNLFQIFTVVAVIAKKVMNRRRKLPSSFVFTNFFFFSDPTTPSTGNATRLCDANGRWTGSEPKCQPIACGDPVTFPHTTVALINGSTSWKAVAQFSCIFGYQPFNGKLNFD